MSAAWRMSLISYVSSLVFRSSSIMFFMFKLSRNAQCSFHTKVTYFSKGQEFFLLVMLAQSVEINWIILISMENYFSFTRLLSLRDSEGANLPLFKDARVKRYQSVERLLELLEVASATRPRIPSPIITLNPLDPEWDDQMPFPVIDRNRYWAYAGGISSLLFFYSYNYNTFTTNIRYRTFRNVFPFLVAYIFADAYASYRKQILKINLFDEYCYLRAQELVKQNEYLLDHPDVRRSVWWTQDFKETLAKVYRQANNNSASDFKDSELILQDFINRYVDPSAQSPMGAHPHLN